MKAAALAGSLMTVSAFALYKRDKGQKDIINSMKSHLQEKNESIKALKEENQTLIKTAREIENLHKDAINCLFQKLTLTEGLNILINQEKEEHQYQLNHIIDSNKDNLSKLNQTHQQQINCLIRVLNKNKQEQQEQERLRKVKEEELHVLYKNKIKALNDQLTIITNQNIKLNIDYQQSQTNLLNLHKEQQEQIKNELKDEFEKKLFLFQQEEKKKNEKLKSNENEKEKSHQLDLNKQNEIIKQLKKQFSIKEQNYKELLYLIESIKKEKQKEHEVNKHLKKQKEQQKQQFELLQKTLLLEHENALKQLQQELTNKKEQQQQHDIQQDITTTKTTTTMSSTKL